MSKQQEDRKFFGKGMELKGKGVGKQGRVDYKQILGANSRGSVVTHSYKTSHLCLTGMNYTNIPHDTIYKSILKF